MTEEYIGWLDDDWNTVLDLGQPIVRCRDCAYICKREYANELICYTCSYFDSEHAEVELNGFCAWGERRENNDDEIY